MMLLLDQVLLQFGTPRGPNTKDIFSTLFILTLALAVEFVIYIWKPKLRSWIKPILFTTIMAVFIFVFTYMVVKSKEDQLKAYEEQQNETTK